MGFSNLNIKSYSVPIKIGGTCRITVTFDYSGPQITKTLHAAIGNNGFAGFDEILNGSKAWTIPNTPSLLTYEAWVDIPITSAIDPDQSPYDLYAKLDGIIPDIISPIYEDLITIESDSPPPEEFADLVITGYTNPVDIGGVCRVNVSFRYKGPAQTRTLYAALGNSGWAGFDEILHGTANLYLARSDTLTTKTASVNIPITEAIDPLESPYDLYAKINGAFPAISSPTYNNVVTVEGGIPNAEFQNLRITDYTTPVKQGQVCQVRVAFEYQGPAQSRLLYAALGNAGGFGFDEVAAGQGNINVPETPTFQTYTGTVNIPVGTGVNPDDSPYDLYAKINGAFPTATSPTVYNVVYVTAEAQPPDPAFRNFKITSFTTPVGPGDICVVKTSFEYQGPAQQKEIHAAIGNSGTFGFDEILNGQDVLSLPQSMSWTPYTAEVAITITAGLSYDDAPYDLYAKLNGIVPDISTPVLQNVLYVKATAGEPEYQGFQITNYDSPVQLGGTCRITVQFDYRGPAVSKPLHVAIGNNGFFGFDEIISKDVTVNLPAADSFTPQTFMVTLQVVGVSVEDSPYDLYAKLGGAFPDVEAPILNNVIGIEGGGPGVGDIVGALTAASPTSFETGQDVQVTVQYDAYTDDPETQLGWQTRLTIQAGSLQGQTMLDHFGPETSQTVQLNLGIMPESSQTGTVTLEGRKADGEWVILDSQAISFTLPGEQPPSEGGFGGLGIVALAALAAVAIAGGGQQKKAAKPRPKARARR